MSDDPNRTANPTFDVVGEPELNVIQVRSYEMT